MSDFSKADEPELTENSRRPADVPVAHTGVVLGKFMPPHRGHEYLAQFASAFVDKLWIFVCSLPNEPIPGALRHQWMSRLFPEAHVVHIQEVNPAANRQQDGAQRIWAQAVLSRLGHRPDYVFASEDYGWKFAEELGARFIPVDPSRDQFPISGSEMRLRPFRNWHFIPSVVRGYFVKEVRIKIQPAPTKNGEDILRRTALLMNTLYVPDYGGFYDAFAGAPQHDLLPAVRRQAQRALTQSLRSQSRCFLLRGEDGGPPADLEIKLILAQSPIGENAEKNRLPEQKADLGADDSPTIFSDAGQAPHAIRDCVHSYFAALF